MLMLALCPLCNCQVLVNQSFNNPESYRLKKLHAGDTAIIRADTVYLINIPLYRLYTGMKNRQGDFQSLLMETTTLYEKRISEQNLAYAQLNDQFPPLKKRFERYLSHANRQIDSLQLCITGAESHLAIAREENRKMTEEVDKLLKQNNSQKYVFSLGGVTLGLIIALLLK